MNTRHNLDFTYNWNSKLRNRCFTTLRLRNDAKYYKGAKYAITLQGFPKGNAKAVDVKYITIDRISDWIAKLDTGYTAKECVAMLKEMYKNQPLINWSTQQLAYCLIEWENQEGMKHLFDSE